MRLRCCGGKKAGTPRKQRPAIESERDVLLRQLAADYGAGNYTAAEYAQHRQRISEMRTHAQLQTELRRLQTAFQGVGAGAEIVGAGAEVAGALNDAGESAVEAADVGLSAAEGGAAAGEGCADFLECCACV